MSYVALGIPSATIIPAPSTDRPTQACRKPDTDHGLKCFDMTNRNLFFCFALAGFVQPRHQTAGRAKYGRFAMVVGLLLACLLLGHLADAARGGRQYGQGLYSVDNGNFGGISIQFEYEFNGTQMKIRITSLNIAYSNKLRQNEPALHQELLRQHVYEGAQWMSSLRIKFTSQISLSAGALLHENPTISGYATNSGSNYSFFEPSEKARKYAAEYAQKQQSNFFTDKARLWGRFEITTVELYKFENKVKAIRRELEAARADHERKFASFISQATSEANRYEFAMAERDLKEAAALVNGNTQRKSQVRNVEQLIEQKKAEKEKMARQAEAEAQQKKQEAAAKARAATPTGQDDAAGPAGSPQGSESQGASGASPTYTQGSSRPGASSSGYGSTGTAASSPGPYKDPELNARYQAQMRKAEETRRNIAAMKAKMEQQQRDARRLDQASDRTFEGFNRAGSFNDYVNASKPLVNEFARQGNAAGAYTAAGIGIGLGVLKAAQANKARNEAARQAQEAKQRQWEQEEKARKKREAERARLRKAAFELLIRQRHTLLEAVSKNDPLPLSTTPVAGDTIYYFIYAIDPTTFDTKRTNVYVSNVFSIARYNDGTWPYQSSIDNETRSLTPFKEVMHGYYLHAEEAGTMRQMVVEGFRENEGVSVVDIAYRQPAPTPAETGVPLSGAAVETGSKTMDLGVPIGKSSRKAVAETGQLNRQDGPAPDLGIQIGPAPDKRKGSAKKQERNKKSETAPLGIRIQP